jgi:hypothetical protein
VLGVNIDAWGSVPLLILPRISRSEDPLFHSLVNLLYPHVAADEESDCLAMAARERAVGEGGKEEGKEGGGGPARVLPFGQLVWKEEHVCVRSI